MTQTWNFIVGIMLIIAMALLFCESDNLAIFAATKLAGFAIGYAAVKLYEYDDDAIC